MSKTLGCSLLLLFAFCCCSGALASATATLTVAGAESQVGAGWDNGNVTVAFNGFTETVHYAQYSSAASLASALAGMFSRDYIGSGLCVHASGGAVTFQLSGTATFGQLQIAGPTSSFQLSGSGWSSQSAVADSGTITLTVNGVTAATTQYGAGATPASVASGLASGVTASSPVTVSADGDSINLQAKQTGSASDYSYTLQTTSYDSTDFSQPSFVNPAVSGTLTGGANQNSSGGTVYSYAVSSYDGVGNLQGMTDSVMGAWTYQYDDLNRVELATDTQPNNPYTSYCWSYDAFGNRTNQEGATAAFATGSGGGNACTAGAGATVSTAWANYDTNNRITGTSQAPAGPTYDAAGDITYDGVNSYLYDAEGRVCAVSSTPTPGVTSMIGYVYNADGERVGKGQITSWSCDPSTNGYRPTNDYVLGPSGEELTELAANSSGSMVWQNTNVYANGQLFATYDNAGLHFLLNDPLGTRRAQTNYAGVLEQTCASLPFGDQLACSDSIENPNPLHFTGKERDTESGNDYFGARYYASNMGRFLSPDWTAEADPVPWANFEDPQSLNLYSYVRNNPLSRTDAFGHADGPCPVNVTCVTVTAAEEDGPDLVPLLEAGGHHFVDQSLVRGQDAWNSLAGQFFRRWSTGKLDVPGLHKGYSTPHRLNSAQIRKIIEEVKKETGRPMSQWNKDDIQKAVDEVQSADGDVDSFLSHIAENNPTARAVTADVQDVWNAANAAMNRIQSSQAVQAVEGAAEEVEQACDGGPACIP